MDKKFYVINYKETTLDGEMEVESGTFDYGFKSLKEAKKYLVDTARDKVEEFDEEEQEDVTESWSDDKEYVSIGFNEETYEYWVYMITIPDIQPPF